MMAAAVARSTVCLSCQPGEVGTIPFEVEIVVAARERARLFRFVGAFFCRTICSRKKQMARHFDRQLVPFQPASTTATQPGEWIISGSQPEEEEWLAKASINQSINQSHACMPPW